MKVSLKWLADYVDITLPAEELAHRMTMAGVEVGEIVRFGTTWDDIYVGEVVRLERHPNADRLLLATVDYGHGTKTVVTGAPNLQVGQKVPFALPGARLRDPYSAELREFVLEPRKIRGVQSEGMVCSARELGLGEDHEGILVLDSGAKVGTPLHLVLADDVFDLELTPNRSDCLSLLGIAYEVAALTGQKVRVPTVDITPTGPDIDDLIQVDIANPDLCPRYSAMVVQGVQVGPSPKWLQDRLTAAGMRPINNVVDVTNYVMLEWGQPLHAFDYDTIRGKKIVVRRAGRKERLLTLDGVDRHLDEDMLVIADAERAVAIAGVMGGAETEVTTTTTNVLLESANFQPTTIRRTSRALRLPSEASRRFERGQPPEHTIPAARRAAQLIQQVAGGTIADGIADAYPSPRTVRQVALTFAEIRRILGVSLPSQQVEQTLASLGFTVQSHADHVLVQVPARRLDVSLPADLCEELARIIGYDELPTTLPTGAVPDPKPNPEWDGQQAVRETLVGCGYEEVIAYSLTSRERLGRLLPLDARASGAESFMAELSQVLLPDDPTVAAITERLAPLHVEPLRLRNPLSSANEVLRTTAFGSLLDLLRDNLRHFDRDVRIFEIGRIYLPRDGDLPEERLVLTAASGAYQSSRRWGERVEVDFFDLKGVAQALLGRFGIHGVEYVPTPHPIFHPGRCAAIVLPGDGPLFSRLIGVVGEVAAEVRNAFDIDERAFLIGMDLHRLFGAATTRRVFRPFGRYPAVVQDVAVVLDTGIPGREVEETIRRAGQPLIKEIELFDVYEGDPVPAGKRSLAYHLTYQSPERTLTDREVAEVHHRVEQALIGELGGQLRA